MEDIPHSTQLSRVGPLLAKQAWCDGKIFSRNSYLGEMVTLCFQERLYGLSCFVVWSPMAPLLPTWIQSPSAASEMVVSQI